jgi:hypothetical protein
MESFKEKYRGNDMTLEAAILYFSGGDQFLEIIMWRLAIMELERRKNNTREK